jgi:hypothetical protein
MSEKRYYIATHARLRAIRDSISGQTVAATIVEDFNQTMRGLGKNEPLFMSFGLTLSSLSDLYRIRVQFEKSGGVFPSDVVMSRLAQAISVLESLEPSCLSHIAPDVPLLSDKELRARVETLLAGSENHDTAINQATQVLEVRLKTLSGFSGRDTGPGLVSKVLNNDPALALLRVSDDPSEQEGFANLCRGVMQFLRNAHHHHFKKVSKEDAYKVCILVDYILAILATAKVKL